MWSLFQSSINPSICLLLMTVWKRGSWASKLSFFPAPCWISRPAVSGSVPGLPWGFPPSQPSGESSLHAERQQFDSQVLVGHRASHTFMSESSCRMVKKKKSLSSSSCISGLILSPSLLKHWHSWLILDDYSRCTKSQGQFFFYMIHERCPMKPKGQHHFHTMCHIL